MAKPKYKVGDIVDLWEEDESPTRYGGVDEYMLDGESRYNRKVIDVHVYGGATPFSYTLDGGRRWNEVWIKGLSKTQRSVSVQDRVKFKFTKKTGTVVSTIDHGIHKGKLLVEWDKEELPTAEEPRNLVVVYSPTAVVLVDHDEVKRLNDERQRLIRIIEAASAELRPITKQWEEAKAGKIVDGS